MNNAIMLFCTTPSSEVSEQISNYLISEHLAACCNIISGIKSIYRWQGNVENDKEDLIIIKTSNEKYNSVEKAIKNLHPYDIPEIIYCSIEGGSIEYLNWISQNTQVKHE
jgi:periplasmic divalent cation tolerance protein